MLQFLFQTPGGVQPHNLGFHYSGQSPCHPVKYIQDEVRHSTVVILSGSSPKMWVVTEDVCWRPTVDVRRSLLLWGYLDKGDTKLLLDGQQSLMHESKDQGRSHVHDLTSWVVLDDVGNLHTTTPVEKDNSGEVVNCSVIDASLNPECEGNQKINWVLLQ